MVNELELIALETEFDLYLGFTKRLALDLPDTKARQRAALWLQKLRSVKDDNFKKLRNEHLKLLLFACHRRAMVGIFEKSPPEDQLECFHDGLTLTEMTRELIEITEKQKFETDPESDPNKCPLPAVSTNLSHDLREYAATQNIPKFGAHIYYAISNEPIQFWLKPGTTRYPPIGDSPNPQVWENSMSSITDGLLLKMAQLDEQIKKQKEIEEAGGDAEEEGKMGGIDFTKKIQVDPCLALNFKWKKDSILRLHQDYDFSNVGIAEDSETQGLWQLEMDEKAMAIKDESLPGRKRVVVREPYYKGLPSDFSERIHHGVKEEIPNRDVEPFCSKYCKDSCPPKPTNNVCSRLKETFKKCEKKKPDPCETYNVYENNQDCWEDQGYQQYNYQDGCLEENNTPVSDYCGRLEQQIDQINRKIDKLQGCCPGQHY